MKEHLINCQMITLDKLDLSERTFNVFKANNINNLFDIVTTKKKDLMKLRNFGKGCMVELEKLLKEYNLILS